MGKRFDPVSQVKLYSDEEYEIFIAEWISTIEGKYAGIFKAKGGGDKGCDVIGFFDQVPSDKWDTYQCKHYDHPVSPSEFVTEIIKLIYFCFVKEYSVPISYCFVAPQGLSNQTLELLRKPLDLRNRIKEDWDEKCPTDKCKISGAEISKFVDGFDLSILTFIEPQDIINQHARSIWHARRFGGGLKPRPIPNSPPEEITSEELTYISELQLVYGEKDGKSLPLDEIKAHDTHSAHFTRQRRYFYNAESLKQFARETLPNNGDFEDLQQQIFDGVVEVAEANHATALEKVDETLSKAKSVPLSDHVLVSELKPADRGGICHQLVNDKRIKWKKK